MPKQKTHLVIIDPNNDFCDPTNGSLYVTGADGDMNRLANHINNEGGRITEIHVTLDSHHLIDCSHPMFWRNSNGDNPPIFTIITSQDIKDGKWIPIFPQYAQRMIKYEEELEKGGKYPHCIWPVHCLIGSNGHKVYPVVFEALLKWQERHRRNVNYITKGSNIWTEHYSAVKAEVPDPSDPSTQINTGFINSLQEADVIEFCGEASSHCGRFTGEDICDAFSDDTYIKKLNILVDVMSPVTGFESGEKDFLEGMEKRGAKLLKTTDF